MPHGPAVEVRHRLMDQARGRSQDEVPCASDGWPEVAREELLFLEGHVVERDDGMSLRVDALAGDLDALDEALEDEGWVFGILALGALSLVLDEVDHLLNILADEGLVGREIATRLEDPLPLVLLHMLDGAVEVGVLEYLGLGDGQSEGLEGAKPVNAVEFQQIEGPTCTEHGDTEITQRIGCPSMTHHVDEHEVNIFVSGVSNGVIHMVDQALSGALGVRFLDGNGNLVPFVLEAECQSEPIAADAVDENLHS